jgi:hypothetical protein
MQENNKLTNAPLRTNIEPGDIVQWIKRKGFIWMTVEAIEGDQAICTYRILDCPLDSNQRPTSLIPQQAYFPLNELEIKRGH